MPESEPSVFGTHRQISIAAKGLSDEDTASLLVETWRAVRQREDHKVPKEVRWDDNKQIDDSIVLCPSQYARNRLKNWEYGRAEALTECRKDASGTDSGLACKQDHELTWRQFDLARFNFVANIRSYNWPKHYIDSLFNFFRNVCTHNLRFRNGGERILLLYASRVRREWHDSLERGEGFNIGIINERLLDAISEAVHNSI
ncbi:hypothetical protein F5887DRAFT_988207 [Amanita rubescens]|nr:hypothetical protein F5887DRAFT_988207 [Amanita rubescens]